LVLQAQFPKIGIQLTASGAIRVDEFSRTTHTIFLQSVTVQSEFRSHPARSLRVDAYAATEFGGHPRMVNLDWVPISLSSQPEAATVGFSETQAREKLGDAVLCYRTRFRALLYCLAGWDERSFIK